MYLFTLQKDNIQILLRYYGVFANKEKLLLIGFRRERILEFILRQHKSRLSCFHSRTLLKQTTT